MSTALPNKAAPRVGLSNAGKLIGAAKAFYSSLSDRAVIDAGSGLFIVVAVSLLLVHYQRPQVPPLPAGTVASSDIIAPENLMAEDSVETGRLRQGAVGSVPPVYEFNNRAARDAHNAIEQMFATGREGSGAANSALSDSIQQSSGLILDPEQLEVLVKHDFNAELQKLMEDHLGAVMMGGVVSSRNQLLKLGATGLLWRDARNGQETTITDLVSIRDLITARAALRSDKLVWPSEYSQRDRSLLSEILGSLIVPNLQFNDSETESRRSAAQNAIPAVVVTVQKGKPIAVRGETITPLEAVLLSQASRRHRIGQTALEFAGTVIIVMLLLLVLWQYMMRYQHRHIRVRRHFLLQIAAFAVTLSLARIGFALAGIISQWATLSPFKVQLSYEYLAPLSIGALLVTLLTDAQAAFVFSAILATFIGVLSGNVYLAAYTLISSVGAIYHLKGCRDRAALIRAGMWIGLVNAAGALALDLLGANEPQIGILLFDLFCGFMSGIFATMVATVLLPLFEWVFEITTDIKLLELSNLNLPLLKQLAERAPGTYHHSIMVGLLAEAAAEAIGADALFSRVACYYHDIGKMVRPTYFVENQSYMTNRHDKLTPRMSSLVLANHVKQGIDLARTYKLPPRIVSIIPEHHGTGLMKFFYYKAREAADGADCDALEHEFRYPGPRPQTKEAAIIMIADSVEAAARTVKAPTPAKLRNMIDTIISRIRDDGQLDESNITLRELNMVAESFVKVLTGIHHHRIAYPGYDFNASSGGATVTAVVEDGDSNGVQARPASGPERKDEHAGGQLKEASAD
jgi:putative nucleotidyltransferase with HDIG domain